MESLTRHSIPLNLLHSDRFCYRENLTDADLTKSIRQLGLLLPLSVIREGKHFQVISGHKRLAALKKMKIKKVDIFLLEAKNPKQLFLTALLFNACSSYSDLDRCLIIRKAGDNFGFSSTELIQTILPQLGLSPSPKVLAQYVQAGKLSESILKLIREQKIPFHGSAGLARLKQPDLEFQVSEPSLAMLWRLG